MNNWLPSPGKLIVTLIAIFALGLGGVVLAFFQEIIAWMKAGRQMFEQKNGPTGTGALGSGAAVAAILTVHQLTGHRYL